MPGARKKNTRFGDTAESITEYILGQLAFVTRVPREQDVGHDFLCALFEDADQMLKAGPFFTVQLKTNYRNIIFKKPYEVEWLRNQENPFYICVFNRKEAVLEFFSTWNVHNSYLYKKTEKITLKLNEDHDWPYPRESRKKHFVPLGEPILRISAQDVSQEELAQESRNILREWILMDRSNIVNIKAKMYFVQGPMQYSTNEPLGGERWVAFYWNAKNFSAICANFGRVATSLRATIRNLIGKDLEGSNEFGPAINALEQTLKSYWYYLDQPTRGFLKDYLEPYTLDGENTNRIFPVIR